MEELERRGGGRRESGGFFLGSRESGADRAQRFVPYDDLDPRCLDTGIVRFASDGYSKLWDLCRRCDMRVVADVHTHPSDWVTQSELDQAHPMIPEKGHLALIVPRFARSSRWSLSGVGVHEYRGGGEWTQWSDGEVDEMEIDRVRLDWR